MNRNSIVFVEQCKSTSFSKVHSLVRNTEDPHDGNFFSVQNIIPPSLQTYQSGCVPFQPPGHVVWCSSVWPSGKHTFLLNLIFVGMIGDMGTPGDTALSPKEDGVLVTSKAPSCVCCSGLQICLAKPQSLNVLSSTVRWPHCYLQSDSCSGTEGSSPCKAGYNWTNGGSPSTMAITMVLYHLKSLVGFSSI